MPTVQIDQNEEAIRHWLTSAADGRELRGKELAEWALTQWNEKRTDRWGRQVIAQARLAASWLQGASSGEAPSLDTMIGRARESLSGKTDQHIERVAHQMADLASKLHADGLSIPTAPASTAPRPATKPASARAVDTEAPTPPTAPSSVKGRSPRSGEAELAGRAGSTRPSLASGAPAAGPASNGTGTSGTSGDKPTGPRAGSQTSAGGPTIAPRHPPSNGAAKNDAPHGLSQKPSPRPDPARAPTSSTSTARTKDSADATKPAASPPEPRPVTAGPAAAPSQPSTTHPGPGIAATGEPANGPSTRPAGHQDATPPAAGTAQETSISGRPTPSRVLLIVKRVAVTAVAVVALVGAVVSYAHMQDLAAAVGEDPLLSYLLPLSVDGMMVAASMVIFVRRRANQSAGVLALVSLFLGGVASLGANVVSADPDVIDPVFVQRLVAGWPPLAVLLAFELLMQLQHARAGHSDSGKGVPVIAWRVTVAAVVVVSLVAAVVSYAHMQHLAAAAGEGWRSWLLPLSVDGMMVVASLAIFVHRRAGSDSSIWLAWLSLVLGVAASLGANVVSVDPNIVDPVLVQRLVAGWPPLAVLLAFELLLKLLRGTSTENADLEPAPTT